MAQANVTSKISSKELTSLIQQRNLQLLYPNLIPKSIFYKNTNWEDIGCVGYNPEQSRLEAVITIKLSTGYSGGLCTNGSKEYVRFFIDYHDGAGWQDAGYAYFKSCDISDAPPGKQHPLQYMVYLCLDDEKHRKFISCSEALIPKVRAILSWNKLPTAGDADFLPYYGNVSDVDIQLKNAFKFTIPNLPVNLIDKLKLNPQPLTYNPEQYKFPDLKSLTGDYKKAKVPEHRFLYATAAHYMADKTVSPYAAIYNPQELKAVNVNLKAIIDVLAKNDDKADVTYEELTCIGLNTSADTLGAVIHIKKQTGFSGDLCHAGSTEYVAFWADWNNDGTFEEYLGTVSVKVHDISNIPAGGLYYNVSMPIKANSHLRACTNPNIVQIRGVLSWQTLPSTTNPNSLNYWGNRKDSLVQIRPGVANDTDLDLVISSISGISVDVDKTHLIPSDINSDGLAEPLAAFPNALRPFGRNVQIVGRFVNSGAPGSIHYKLQFSDNNGGSWQDILDNQIFIIEGAVWPFDLKTENPSLKGGWITYYPGGSTWERSNLLGFWDTGSRNGKILLRVIYSSEPYTVPYTPSVVHESMHIPLMLDNTGYSVNPNPGSVLSSSYTLDIIIDGGDCNFITKGTILNGKFKVIDDYFYDWYLRLEPTAHFEAGKSLKEIVTLTVPSGLSDVIRYCNSASDTGNMEAEFSVNTDYLSSCGYTVSINAWDRSIVGHRGTNADGTYSFGVTSHYANKYVGFAVFP
jgi:hypothetical protein